MIEWCQNGASIAGGFVLVRICLVGSKSDKMEYIAPNELWIGVRMEEGHFLMLGHNTKCFIVIKLIILFK